MKNVLKVFRSKSYLQLACVFLLFSLLISSIILINSGEAATAASVTVDFNTKIGTDSHSVGMKLDYEWKTWRDSATLRQMAKDAGFKFVAFYTWKRGSSPTACTYWNEATKTGTFDWTNVDSLIRRILEIGAVPLLSLGGYDLSSSYRPPGMATNPATGLPYTTSWAAYSAQWVKHFSAVGLPVKYYEITTEPFKYFGWTPDMTKLAYYTKLWNAAARAMRAVNPNIYLSHDFITAPKVLNYWITYGDNIDFLDFHKYDSYALSGTGYSTDAELFSSAETSRFETSSSTYGVYEARQKWYSARGKWLPVIDSETNLNSAWRYGTDPRMQKMSGAVWTALMLRKSILKGMKYTAYFQFASYGQGFGMVNLYNNKAYYPYYVNKWLGVNLKVGDSLYKSTYSYYNLRSLAWTHNYVKYVLIISKTTQYVNLVVNGLSGSLTYYKIDNTLTSVQSGIVAAGSTITLKGYTVMLLRSG